MGTTEGRGHIFHSNAPHSAKQISTAYAHWVATVEIAFLETHDIPLEERTK